MPQDRIKIYVATALAALVCGCQSVATHPSGAATTDAIELRNNLYSLLYQLLSDERHVSKLLIIKRESRDLNHLVKRISDAAANGADHLKEFAKREASLNLEVEGLPPGERAARRAIAHTKRNQLLSSSGETFERSLLLTQMEALNYAAHLAQVAADHESAPGRAEYLSTLSQTMKELHSDVLLLLFNHNQQAARDEPIARQQKTPR
jgi:hypothetical protein